MIALLQRVSQAEVRVAGETVGRCGRGYLVLFCAEKGDTPDLAKRLASKTARLRIFEDEAGKMNRSLADVKGEALVVSQFTLAADTRSGTRPRQACSAPIWKSRSRMTVPSRSGSGFPLRQRIDGEDGIRFRRQPFFSYNLQT
jgi:D-tyrosyl-tRNA(Tyr) deacylase